MVVIIYNFDIVNFFVGDDDLNFFQFFVLNFVKFL